MSVYNVTVIPQNLRREETIVQIAESLNYLSQIADDIFKKVNAKLQLNSKNLNGVSARIEKAKNKISIISAAKSSIQVFSNSRYPVTDNVTPYKSIFLAEESIPSPTKFSVKYNEITVKDEPLEKLQFFHITYSRNKKKLKSEGLGDTPIIEYTNDFLLYNSGKNPYSQYVISDTLNLSQYSKKQDVSEKDEIGAAPSSISDRGVTPRVPSENYFYSPDLGEVPTLDVPIDLPDLPGIADDLRYVDKTEAGIAPSVVGSTHSIQLVPASIESVPTEVVVIPPPLLPPPLQDQQQKSPEQIMATKTTQSQEVAVVEEPIKKIPVVETKIKIQTEEILESKPVDTKQENKVGGGPDLHASLMDAIRKAGGARNAKLKSTDTNENQRPAKPSGGDLMAEFHSKLSLRRKGISGDKKLDAASVMERISEQLIPPPSASDKSDSDTTNEEWD